MADPNWHRPNHTRTETTVRFGDGARHFALLEIRARSDFILRVASGAVL